MISRISGAVTAAVLLLGLTAAGAQTPTLSGPLLVIAQASPSTEAPARRSRKKKESASKKEPTAGQMSARERQKQCGAEWREAKAAGKLEKGMKWPKFWSQCNARLKGNSA